ncbi:MAG: hypothetical protein F6J94_19565 [Moorea sp. SIO1F2]|uniref:hypothetical protein n=1 Tax=Moorena sp. SIO1F2 TaxID=2607819 RepID=UPI0013BD47AA|nr:hypothetical protein [Moorena sp. SIO1F2]NET84035.1 hypothetical protein [Moorena sp. SIO1F2]
MEWASGVELASCQFQCQPCKARVGETPAGRRCIAISSGGQDANSTPIQREDLATLELAILHS